MSAIQELFIIDRQMTDIKEISKTRTDNRINQ